MSAAGRRTREQGIGKRRALRALGRGALFGVDAILGRDICDEDMVARCGLGYEFCDGELRHVGADGDYD